VARSQGATSFAAASNLFMLLPPFLAFEFAGAFHPQQGETLRQIKSHDQMSWSTFSRVPAFCWRTPVRARRGVSACRLPRG
jgi:hypothetical protein